ncbi:MAG: riboflavin biosynthesis protein RibF, partial [Pseudomonadota bacterium]
YLHPARGVYAVRAGIVGADGAEWHDGAASFGLRPQFDGRDARLEVFLLDYSGDLYGRTLRVAFHAWLRGEQRFESVDGLVAQMHRDVAETRRRLADLPRPGPAD